MKNKKLIVLGGPTASGKTALAIMIAQHYKTHILSADSRQCYRELNIGVAKPSEEELKQVQHSFINSHSIHDEVSAGTFERYGLAALDTIFQQHDVAVCVGGTGMYMKALCEGIDEMPKTNADITKQVENAYHECGIKWLQDEMLKQDERFYHSGENKNPSRLIRALSFKLSTGKSILEYRNHQAKTRDFEIFKLCIEMDRDELYQRINKRVDWMMEAGLLEEVRSLLPFRTLKSLNTVGYSELFDYFDGTQPLQYCIEKIKQHSRNYAKRQITWFKNQTNYQFLPSDDLFKLALSLE